MKYPLRGLMLGAICCALFAARGADAAELLTLADCLAIAEAYNPSAAAAAASISSDIAKVKQAAVDDRLTVNGNLSQGRGGGDSKDDESTFSAGASASIKIYDSGRSKYRIRAARADLDATRQTAEQTMRDIRADVKTAYTDLLLYGEIVTAREESVRAYEAHLVQARAFYEAGTRAKSDVTKAEVDLGSARLELVQAQSDVVVGKASLMNAMGVSIEDDFEIAPIDWQLPKNSDPDYWELSSRVENDAVETALANRADYRAKELGVESSLASLAATARQSSPSISLSGGYNGSGSHIGNVDKGWTTSLALSVPIVDGGSAAADLEQAKATVASGRASLEKLRQSIILDVRRALNGLRTARESITLSELTLANARENFRLASGRYETGVGSSLEVTDALVSLTDAILSASRARSSLGSAIISLERALGVELADPVSYPQ